MTTKMRTELADEYGNEDEDEDGNEDEDEDGNEDGNGRQTDRRRR